MCRKSNDSNSEIWASPLQVPGMDLLGSLTKFSSFVGCPVPIWLLRISLSCKPHTQNYTVWLHSLSQNPWIIPYSYTSHIFEYSLMSFPSFSASSLKHTLDSESFSWTPSTHLGGDNLSKYM